MSIELIAQPQRRTTLEAIEASLCADEISRISVAAAYATSGGVHLLLDAMEAATGCRWPRIQKRWITSFDYCRSHPVGLEALMCLPGSQVRVYDAVHCLEKRCIPRVPFHPKVFLFQGASVNTILAGSGNVSRSGLTKGIEAGLVVSANSETRSRTAEGTAVRGLRSWYSSVWRESAILDPALLREYQKLFDATEHLLNPVPTEDDFVGDDGGRGGLDSTDLRKLRVCNHLWIEAGRISHNRGPNRPGNQLMMKRLSRVFFGFDSARVPQNTLIGTVGIEYSGNHGADCSLRFSDNSMDVLTLPVPEVLGLDSYDDRNLLFTRVAPGHYSLQLGSPLEKRRWIKKSKSIEAYFKMSSGRQWGVF